MKSYIIKPKSVKKSEMLEREYIFSATGYYKVPITKHWTYLEDILDSESKGQDMEEKDFLSFQTQSKYLKTASLTGDNFLLDEISDNTFEYISPELNSIFRNKKRKIEKYDILYTSTGSNNRIGDCTLATKNLMHNFSSHIFLLKPKCDKFYLFAILKSQYGKDSCDLEVPKAGIMRRGGKRFLKIKVPFPTTANHQNPEKVENLVSLIVQNIIDKEEHIKLKNKQIDELIEKELKENQKAGNFSYSYPRISEIREETRLDTGLYEREFKEIDFLIRNYEGGFSLLDIFVEKFFSGTTPKFFEKKDGNFPYFVRPTEYNDKRVYTDLRKINFDRNISKYRIDKKEGIILPRKGGTNTIYKPENFNVLIGDSVKFGIFKNINVSFLASFLSSNIVKFQLERIKSKTNGGSLTEKNLRNLLIPNFPESKQQEIAKLYYNPLEKNKDLDLENYLQKEQARNHEIGIFQLNMEIFTLREQLEDLVHKIVMEEKIENSMI